MQQSVLDEAPWWLPADWQVVALGLAGGIVLTQLWKQWWRYHHGREKPRNAATAFVAIIITSVVLTLYGWLEGQLFKTALRTGLMWGLPAPVIWMAVQWALRRWLPGLAYALGENRRAFRRRVNSEWSEEDREKHRREMFGDTLY